MSLLVAAGVAAGAAVGAPLRYLVAQRLDSEAFPWGTLAVNVLGSGLLGVVGPFALEGLLWGLVVAGFCGGLTTYSSFAVQVRDLGRRAGVGRAAAYAVGTIGLALLACSGGYGLGTLLT